MGTKCGRFAALLFLYIYSSFQTTRSQPDNKIICEFSSSTIECTSSILILSATYGRTESVVHGCLAENDGTLDCSTDVLGLVKQSCDGKQSCNLEAENSYYGDPCPMVLKYLNITFVCIAPSPPTTEESHITSDGYMTTNEGSGELPTSADKFSTSISVTTSDVEISTSDVNIITGKNMPNTGSEESIVTGIIVGVAVAVGLTALFIVSFAFIVFFRKRRSRLSSDKTKEYHVNEDGNKQTENDKQTNVNTNIYSDIRDSSYGLDSTNNVNLKVDDSDGYMDARGIYTGDTLSRTETEDIYDYINESEMKDNTEFPTEYLDLDKREDERQYQDLR